MNREAAHVILDRQTAIVNGKVVAVSEEGAIVVIEEEVTVIFENGKVIANGEAECEMEPSAAILLWRGVGDGKGARSQLGFKKADNLIY